MARAACRRGAAMGGGEVRGAGGRQMARAAVADGGQRADRGAAAGLPAAESGEQAAFELKVDVVWGRAYIAALLVNNRFPQITWALRGHSEGAAVPYDPADPSRAFHTALEWGSSHWVFSEGHMPCVWALAERTARAMGADQVRIDIFVARHRQEGCVLNEISLSSGNPLGAHDRFLARAWLLPWLSSAYTEGRSTLPVYGRGALHDQSEES
mmetsp:Transcript_742/g.1866  ORF Transcript_742/g.1866 Transcript_742/m.1866 type:complete len:212 (-) Transcript_742:109-744(-)